ncbi:uncharacterized protein LOC135163944 [Diachasmimorpha longicaudata]|uniref:uncharacterized protein LOC135163944 n=1 Tax=Diachasmimorpha longicaudata TaxID=58733 RepID=UPI0030B8B557
MAERLIAPPDRTMQATRREREYLRAANERLRWEDAEGETLDGENIFAIQDLQGRAAKWLADMGDEAYMAGARWEGGVGPDTPRAHWIRALRREARELDAEGEQVLTLYEIEDAWALRIHFGEEPPNPTTHRRIGTWISGTEIPLRTNPLN